MSRTRLAENLFLAYQQGAGERYRELGRQYLDDIYYDPLARGESNLNGRHAYSHVNSLSSAMQAYLTLGSEKHFRAARNAFDMVEQQSFATGGWDRMRCCARPAATTSTTASPSRTTVSRRPAAPMRTSRSRVTCCASHAIRDMATAWSA